MALVKAESPYLVHTREEYEAKKRKIYASVNSETERLFQGMIYCRKCHNPKVADFPERNFITRCDCRCEAEQWERERKMAGRTRLARPKEYRSGDWNPFD